MSDRANCARIRHKTYDQFSYQPEIISLFKIIYLFSL